MTELATAPPAETHGSRPVPAPASDARAAAVVAIVAALLAVALTAIGSVRGSDPTGVVLAGALATAGEGDGRELAAGAQVPQDVPVRAGASGAAVRVAGSDLELLPGAAIVLGPDRVEVVAGGVLVSGREVARLQVGSTELRGRGVWRVDAGAAGRVATYLGRVQVDDGARALQLARYEQVDLRGGAVGGAAVPLRYRERDAWDRTHLADALAADRLARQLATSLNATHGADLRPRTFYASFAGTDELVLDRLDELAPRALEGRFGPPSDVLLGVAVADALVEDAGFLPGPALARVVELRRGGATWGLVLVANDLGSAALGSAAGRALDRAADDGLEPGPAGDAGGGTDPAGGSTGEATGRSGGIGTGPADGTGTAAGGTSPGGTSPGGTAPSPSPAPTPAPSPTPDPPDDDPGSPVEDLLRDGAGTVTELLEGLGSTVTDVLG